jgi:hypothetical protein
MSEDRPSWMLEKKEAAAHDKRNRERMQLPDRFWVPKDERRRYVAIDDDPQPAFEHNPSLPGQGWNNHFSCPNTPNAPCCKKLGRRYDKRRGYGRWTRYFYTVVSMRSWTDQRGNVREFEMQFMAALYNSFDRLETKRQRKGGFAGWVVEAYRDSSRNDPDIGGEHEFLQEVTDHDALFAKAMYRGKKLSKWYNEAEQNAEKMVQLQRIFQVEFDEEGKLVRRVPAFNYAELLAPPTNEEIEDMLITMGSGGSSGGSPSTTSYSGSGNGGEVAEDDIPF